mmetsp:Transcript_14487/g.42214  ORF Transcript_14487/g.42214 Transcript_14487/m.42214 type:complete len:552 (-) Transcript_14487:266-1921(-)
MDNRSYFNEIQKCKKGFAAPQASAFAASAAYAPRTAAGPRAAPQQRRLAGNGGGGGGDWADDGSEDTSASLHLDIEDRRASEAEVEHVLRATQRDQWQHRSAVPKPSFAPLRRRMGFTFRDSRSTAVVWFGRRTVKDGECCGIWNLQGEYRAVPGPKRKFLLFSRVRFMDRHIADSHQYLEIRYRSGAKEHKRGPLAMFEDPVQHESICVMNAVTVDAFEVIVVYTEDTQGSVKRDVIHGPTVFIPEVNQWLHVFRWHGSKGDDQYSKVPGALVFTKLRTIADQFYYNAQGVRTSDDASLTVKFMIFFQLDNLELMLNSTHDPIGDFINALLADLMNFSSRHSYEEFIQCAAQLSDLSTFPVLCERACAVGFKIGKVVYRGYQASGTLQSLCDAAIKTRTELKLKQEEQEMKQAMKSRELQGNSSRGGAERAEEEARQSHRLALEVAAHKQQLEVQEQEHEERLRQATEQAKAELEAKRAADTAQLQYLSGLASLGVDLTSYLVASNGKQPDKVVKMLKAAKNAQMGGASATPPSLPRPPSLAPISNHLNV